MELLGVGVVTVCACACEDGVDVTAKGLDSNSRHTKTIS